VVNLRLVIIEFEQLLIILNQVNFIKFLYIFIFIIYSYLCKERRQGSEKAGSTQRKNSINTSQGTPTT